ncbi:MAG: nitroreductase family protein [Candidatus Aminicenantes bacterium]|nr:nitroreductase family protein [Candidatus Aminicenantes bacterium]MCK5004362.1 nitroreductase family protein [Candidatus Aminicenantes bacterium]
MDFSELVKKRYSCRRYLPDIVEKEKIEKCIDSARLSPSACNSQPWSFIVVDDPEKLASVSDAAVSGIYGAPKLMAKSPALIVVIADKGSFMSKVGGMVRETSFFLIDIGIACEHLVLQATELGLGTCYIGWFNEKAVRKELGLKRSVTIPLIITMGYPDESHRSKDITRRLAKGDNRKPINEIMKYQ